MKKVLAVLYTEPVVFLGALAAGVAALGAAEVIPLWIAPVLIAIVTPIQRHFVTPNEDVPDAPFEDSLEFAGDVYEPNRDRERLGADAAGVIDGD